MNLETFIGLGHNLLAAARKTYYKVRFGEAIRLNPRVAKAIYLGQSVVASNFGEFRRRVLYRKKSAAAAHGLALCLRVRDEARYLTELIEYYIAAGVDHFFLYEKLSQDKYYDVLQPFISQGLVTLADNWPEPTMSPSAECACVLNAVGRFEWVGFVDCDEFVVVRDGRSLPEFLEGFQKHPAVALHWRLFGSSGHLLRPNGPVIHEYRYRAVSPNNHVKCFVRPQSVANYRNSHSFYYQGMRRAVNEHAKPVSGSVSFPSTAEHAWINHYHHKSNEDYFEKLTRRSIVDKGSLQFANRTLEQHFITEQLCNKVYDQSAVDYYLERCKRLARAPRIPLATRGMAAQTT